MLTIYADAFLTATRHKDFNLHKNQKLRHRGRWRGRRAYLDVDLDHL
ncbi:MAG: hypothetical protein AAF943_06480 [Pseudomonadota bacterium]